MFFFSVTSPQYIGTALLGIQCDYTYSMYMRPTLHADARRRHMTASRHDQNINTGTHTDAGGAVGYMQRAASGMWTVSSKTVNKNHWHTHVGNASFLVAPFNASRDPSFLAHSSSGFFFISNNPCAASHCFLIVWICASQKSGPTLLWI